MHGLSARWWRWAIPLGLAVAGLLTGSLFGGAALGAQDTSTRPDEDFSVHVTRIENPESLFLRSAATTGATTTNPDMFFYKVRDNKNGRILYFMYYKGNMLAPLYTTGD